MGDLTGVLQRLDGWTPALLESQKTLLALAGLAGNLPVRQSMIPGRWAGRQYGYRPYSLVEGDVFFRDSEVYFAYAVGEYPPDFQRIVIGIVTNGSADPSVQLTTFSEALENAIRGTLDGRRTRHMSFSWCELPELARNQRLLKLLAPDETKSGPTFIHPEIGEEELLAVTALSGKSHRDTLIEVAKVGFAREQDILGPRPKAQPDDVRDTLSALEEAGLIQSEYLLVCKQTGAPLTRLDDPAKLNDPAIGGLPCPSCSGTFAQEALVKGYAASSLGRRLTQGSHWMTILVTQNLVKLGVPLDSIAWNVSESGGEVDLLVEFLPELWIFELKDREFGAGDAYPLNHRQVRYDVNRAFIVTTEKVSKDAKRVFQELAQASKGSRGADRSGPVYIEGLESIGQILEKEVVRATLEYTLEMVSPLTQSSGYDFETIIGARFGLPVPKKR